MRKFYALMFAAALAGNAQAQVMEQFKDVTFSKFSPNGDWLVENLQGTMQVLQRSTGAEYSSADPDGLLMYGPGLGQSITNTGIIVGMNGEYAGIWQDGEWIDLPQTTGIGTTYNTAHAITPDASRICGVLGNDGAMIGGEMTKAMAYPVVWNKKGNGDYELVTLPYPEKDFAGCIPQYVTAVVMSDDGRTVVGQVRDYSGFFTMPIVYTEAADGTWSYRMIGESWVYDKTKIDELPPMPTSPTYPQASDYMSEDDVDKYNEAMDYYNEQMDLYYQGIIDTYPDYPMESDYISDAGQKAAYEAAITKYNEDVRQFNTDYTNYVTKRDEIVTNKDFMQNALYLTSDGRYLGVTLSDRNSADDWGGSAEQTVGYFDLSQENPDFVEATEPGDYIVTGILNDGTMLYASPSMENTRNSFVVLPDANKTKLTFGKYIEQRNAAAGKWLADNNTYDVTIWGFDDDWNPIVEDVVKDSLVTGTVSASADGKVFVSYYTDSFTDSDISAPLSYMIDLSDVTGIGSVAAEQKWATKPRYYNMQGQQLHMAPASGLYIECKDGKNVKVAK